MHWIQQFWNRLWAIAVFCHTARFTYKILLMCVSVCLSPMFFWHTSHENTLSVFQSDWNWWRKDKVSLHCQNTEENCYIFKTAAKWLFTSVHNHDTFTLTNVHITECSLHFKDFKLQIKIARKRPSVYVGKNSTLGVHCTMKIVYICGGYICIHGLCPILFRCSFCQQLQPQKSQNTV